ncbi:MAG TPA: four helix bundle protein [Saprospiraceae bacterium]|nr:four helix bundle protein [Saprospiraceae bacterium]
MKTENVIQTKSFAFAIRVVSAYQFLTKQGNEYVLSKQLLRSGTSVGANVEEAIGGQSRRDFFAKMSIAYKEAREAVYWIRLLEATGYIPKIEAQSLMTDAEELCKIIGSIQISTKKSITKKSITNKSITNYE